MFRLNAYHLNALLLLPTELQRYLYHKTVISRVVTFGFGEEIMTGFMFFAKSGAKSETVNFPFVGLHCQHPGL